MPYYVYILASVRRVYEHKNDVIKGFTKRYGVHDLVWFEVHEDINEAILREKRIKKWNRTWKKRVIEETNPEWVDLYSEIAS
jgi:putative endonuclease